MKINVLSMQGSDSVARGYLDAMRYLGCHVYDCRPLNKMEVCQLIQEYDVRLIFTRSKYGIRQLPIDVINKYGVAVVIRALPMNAENETLAGPYEYADPLEAATIRLIDRKFVWTPMHQSAWPTYMHGWLDKQVELFTLPYAGNLLTALPDNLRTTVDVCTSSMNANQPVSEMIIRRLEILGKTYGDCSYGNALVVPNLHSAELRTAKAYLNEACFMISMYGGIQVTDLDIAKHYLSDYVDIATNSAQLVSVIEQYIDDPVLRLNCIKKTIPWISVCHSYFNRLNAIFEALTMSDYALEAQGAAERLGNKHVWEMTARLNAEERGELYEAANLAKIG